MGTKTACSRFEEINSIIDIALNSVDAICTFAVLGMSENGCIIFDGSSRSSILCNIVFDPVKAIRKNILMKMALRWARAK